MEQQQNPKKCHALCIKKKIYLSRYFSDWIPQLKTPAIAAVFSIVQYNKIKTNNKNNERKKIHFSSSYVNVIINRLINNIVDEEKKTIV